MVIRRWANRLSLTQQWISATLLAVLPLMLAIGYAGWALTVQAQEQRALLMSINGLKALDAAVARQVTGLERSARQYYLIGEWRFFEIYQERLQALRGYQRDLVYTLPMQTDQHVLGDLVRLTADIGRKLSADLNAMSETELDQAWREVNQLKETFSTQVDTITERAMKASEAQLDQVIRRLLLLGSLAIPGTVFLIVLSTITMVRPLWRLAGAIHRLGHHHWDEPVAIEGPADFTALGASLEWMREQLLISDRQKEAFVRHMTHELKSPLAAIVEAESLLSDQVPGPVNEAQRNVLKILRQGADNLGSLIQQLLNYNAVKHSLKPETTAVNVPDLCARVRDQLSAIPANSHLQWHYQGEPDTVFTDYACLEMILSNLLSNACSALAGKGRIDITWGTEDNGWWLTVADNGPGIEEGEVEHIFKPFYQGKKRRQGPLKGSGIGLSIVYECVTTLGGVIDVTSSPGNTRFHVRLPANNEGSP